MRGRAFPTALARLESLSAKIHEYQYWEIAHESVQRFLAKETMESERVVAQRRARADILHRHSAPQGTVAGFVSVDLDPYSESQTQRALDEAIFAASLMPNPDFKLLKPDGIHYQPIRLADSRISHSPRLVLDEIQETILDIVHKHPALRLSSAEIFLDTSQSIFQNSWGLQGLQEETKVEVLLVLLHGASGHDSEIEIHLKARDLEGLDLQKKLTRAMERVSLQGQAQLPPTGQFDVVFTGETLPALWNWVVHQTNAQAVFSKTASLQVGQSLADGKIEGEFLNLSSDATVDLGLHSYTFDFFGQPSLKVPLVRGSKINQVWADKRYADYLQVPCTGQLGMIHVDRGNLSESEILRPDGGKPIFLIEQFSSFDPNSVTGAFSGEIRFAQEISSQGRRPIRGGSISGKMNQALRRLFLSQEELMVEKYLGPRFVRLNGLTVAGA